MNNSNRNPRTNAKMSNFDFLNQKPQIPTNSVFQTWELDERSSAAFGFLG
jgi:hypothetical protein